MTYFNLTIMQPKLAIVLYFIALYGSVVTRS